MKKEIFKHKENDFLWKPTYEWYLKTAGIILVVLAVIFFVFNIILQPYMREINPVLTPWLVNDTNAKVMVK
jgi:drug/metabolite transporter (DMT)-like permease